MKALRNLGIVFFGLLGIVLMLPMMPIGFASHAIVRGFQRGWDYFDALGEERESAE